MFGIRVTKKASRCYSHHTITSASALPEKKHHFTQMLYHCFVSFKLSPLDFFKLAMKKNNNKRTRAI